MNIGPGWTVNIDSARTERTLNFIRCCFRRGDKYGCDNGGDLYRFTSAVGDFELVDEIAEELNRIDILFAAATAPLFDKINEADKKRADAERALTERVRRKRT